MFEIKTSKAMENLGQSMADFSVSGTVIYLEGGLGAGKTTLTRGFLRGFGHVGHVRSPTFNLYEIYQVDDQTICHLDLYRLKEPEEVIYTGVMDYFNGKNICLIEWPEKGKGFLPEADVFCDFNFVDDPDLRILDIVARSAKGKDLIKKISLGVLKK